MEKINQDTINLLLSKKVNENFWLFELGRADALFVSDANYEHQFMNSFFDKGVQQWDKYQEILKEYLCDSEKKEPKQFVKNLTSGGMVDFINNLIEFLQNNHDIILAIAIPLCGILINKGVTTLCK